MKDEYVYLNDEELEALIAEVENSGMIAPPVYLKERILEEALGKEVSPGGPQTDLVLRAMSGGLSITEKEYTLQRAKRQFWIYSFKVAAAAAVAVFCLTAIPMDRTWEGMSGYIRMEKRIEEDAERYEEEKQKALEDTMNMKFDTGFMDGHFGSGSREKIDSIWNRFTDWFGLED